MPLDLVNHGAGQGVRDGCASTATLQPFPGSYFCADPKLANLAEGVSVARGRSEVRFDGAKHALARLYSLAQALGNDYGRFEELVGRGVGGGEVVTE